MGKMYGVRYFLKFDQINLIIATRYSWLSGTIHLTEHEGTVGLTVRF